MRDLLSFVLFIGLVLLLVSIAVVLCITADRVQLCLSYRAAQRRFRRYRQSDLPGLPPITQTLLNDPGLLVARDLEVTYPAGLEPDETAYYHIAHFVPPTGGVLYSSRRLNKLGLVPFARADSISLYCAPQNPEDLRVWSYSTKSRKAFPIEIEYPRFVADFHATLSPNQALEPTADRRETSL